MRLALHALGLSLVLLGVGLWLATGREQTTALIPAFVGAVEIMLASAAARPGVAKSALRGGFLFALVGAAGGLAMGLPKWIASLQGQPLERPLAVAGQIGMGVLCAVYVLSHVKRRG
ncbi:MAG: hypothetical protein AB7T63_10905 [Planctomycetota bacterium]